MKIGQLIIGFVFLAFGGLNVVKPEIYIKYQKWIFKTIYRASFVPSDKTIKINRLMGVVIVLIGFLMLIS